MSELRASRTENTLVAGLAGTSAMTLYGYLASLYEKETITMPQLLGALLKDLVFKKNKRMAKPAGWVGHYVIGIGFSMVYKYLYKVTKARPTLQSALVLGIFSGLTGVGFWHFLFKIHPQPPRTNLKKFYSQLVIAHVVYGIATVLTMRQCSHLKHSKGRSPIPLQC